MPSYELRISDWSSDVCSSDLKRDSDACHHQRQPEQPDDAPVHLTLHRAAQRFCRVQRIEIAVQIFVDDVIGRRDQHRHDEAGDDRIEAEFAMFGPEQRSEEHTSELQSLMRISYAVICLKKNYTI